MLEACLKLLELGYYEVKFAFEGLADGNVWKRPAPGLLSVGELAGHIAFWEAVRLAGDGPDGFAQLRFRPSVYEDALEAYLEQLYVIPDRRGEGLGRALLDAAMETARERGATMARAAVPIR